MAEGPAGDLWLATDSGLDRWDRQQQLTRSKDQEVASDTVSIEECLTHATVVGKRAADLREAIAVGNGTFKEMELDPALFQ